MRSRLQNAVLAPVLPLAVALVLALSALSSPLFASTTQDPEYLITRWNADQGFPETTVSSVAQTPDGYLWFGTFDGLLRFNGVTFEVFDPSNTPELPDQRIVNLYLDHEQRLWISTYSGTVYVKDGKWHTFAKDTALHGDYVWRFAEDTAGNVYMTTFNRRLNRFHDDRFDEIPAPPRATPEMGFIPYVAPDGAFWVINGTFIGQYANGAWQETLRAADVFGAAHLRAQTEFAAARGPDGSLWILTGDLLTNYRDGKRAFESRPPFHMYGFWGMNIDQDGTVWISTLASGLYRFSPSGGWRHLGVQDGIADQFVRTVFRDREGNWWVCTNGGGIERLKRRTFYTWGVTEGVPGQQVWSVTTAPDGAPVLGSEGAGIAEVRDNRFQHLIWPGEKNDHDRSVRALLVDHAGGLWAAIPNGSFYHFDHLPSGADNHLPEAHFVLKDGPQYLFEDSHHRIWADQPGGAVAIDGNTIAHFTSDVPLNCFAENPKDGSIWACSHSAGVRLLQGDRFVVAPGTADLTNCFVSSALFDDKGSLWIGTEFCGLNRLRDGELKNARDALGSTPRGISAILPDRMNNFWIMEDSGVIRVSRQQLSDALDGQPIHISVQRFNRGDGLSTTDFSANQPAATLDPAGRVWLASMHGAQMVDPRDVQTNSLLPPLAIEDILLDGRSTLHERQFATSGLEQPVSLDIPPGTHRIEIHYAALSFVAPEKIQFRYMLSGLDKEWINVGNRRVLYLQDVKPGHYQLLVAAANDSGVWNETRVATLNIKPHFYQTYLFFALCFCTVALVGTGAYRQRIRSIRYREIELEKLVRRINRELQERKRVEAELRRSEDQFAKAFRSSPAALSISSLVTGKINEVNDVFVKTFGWSREELVGHEVNALGSWVHPEERAQIVEALRQHNPVRNVETDFRTKSGKIIRGLVSAEIVTFAGDDECLLNVVLDITDLKQLEDRLLQSQKMEAVGKLAGGVAHDFNNLLTVIKGYSSMLLEEEQVPHLKQHVERISEAAQRAAGLTTQLLAFSRRQVLQPKTVNLNTLVLNITKMLHRILGEDIEIRTKLTKDLGTVKADPGQFEQVLINLAVNARDAMPRGGKLTIETANVELDESAAQKHAVVSAGHYVLLAVSDTGVGMDAETQSHIFEPFFTTKEVGKGTGLGLSMVYGTVKQSGGSIWVYSEVGHGTSFKVYLPRMDSAEELQPAEKPRAASGIRGSETILVVEDDRSVRELTRSILEACGYDVVVAGSPLEVKDLCDRHARPIDLLLTDVVMPGLGGRELAQQMQQRFPGIRVLYMSGYTTNAIVHHGVLDEGTYFLQKPFLPAALAEKVREVLNKPAPNATSHSQNTAG